MCVDLVEVFYQPVGGSHLRHTVDNTTATSATLPNLQCNTEYIISVDASGGQTVKESASRRVSLPARGMHILHTFHPRLQFMTLSL